MAAMAGAAAAEAVSDWTVREDVRIADAFREARLQVVAARRRAAAVAASIARMQERGSTGVRVVAMAAVAAAEEAEAEVAEAAEAAGHLLQTRLRARETHARARTSWQGEPVGEDSGETPSLGVAARQEGYLDASRAVMADGQSKRMEQSLLSGLGPRPARSECRRRGGAAQGQAGLCMSTCARGVDLPEPTWGLVQSARHARESPAPQARVDQSAWRRPTMTAGDGAEEREP